MPVCYHLRSTHWLWIVLIMRVSNVAGMGVQRLRVYKPRRKNIMPFVGNFTERGGHGKANLLTRPSLWPHLFHKKQILGTSRWLANTAPYQVPNSRSWNIMAFFSGGRDRNRCGHWRVKLLANQSPQLKSGVGANALNG